MRDHLNRLHLHDDGVAIIPKSGPVMGTAASLYSEVKDWTDRRISGGQPSGNLTGLGGRATVYFAEK
jgi:hypothetical protein